VDDNSSLGEFILQGISPAPKGESLVEVSFDYDVNGIVKVTARDRQTGVGKSITIRASKSRLTQDDISLAERDVSRMSGSLIAQREKGKLLYEGQGVYERLKTLEKQVVDGRKKMGEVELAKLRSLAEDMEQALRAEDEEAIEQLVDKCSIILSDWGL
jgi:molecular chaperone DnaK (HSP70)